MNKTTALIVTALVCAAHAGCGSMDPADSDLHAPNCPKENLNCLDLPRPDTRPNYKVRLVSVNCLGNTATFEITNIGRSHAYPLRVQTTLNGKSQTNNLNGLHPGQSQQWPVPFTHSKDFKLSGSYRIDPYKEINESSETDNTGSFSSQCPVVRP